MTHTPTVRSARTLARYGKAPSGAATLHQSDTARIRSVGYQPKTRTANGAGPDLWRTVSPNYRTAATIDARWSR